MHKNVTYKIPCSILSWMKGRALARPGGKLLCSQRIKWKLLYAAEGDLHGSIPALLQGEHEALIHPSECLLPSGHATEYLCLCANIQLCACVHRDDTDM